MTTIYATTQFWGEPADTKRDTLALCRRKWELSDLDRVCFECLLPECDQKDPRCPHNDDQSSAKRVYDMAFKSVRREVGFAVEQILEEREAQCATSSQE